jgi:hypothetical protein
MAYVKQPCRYCAYLPLTEAYLPLAECACRPAAPEWRKFACSRVPRQARGTTATPMWGLGAKCSVGSPPCGMWYLTHDILLSARNGMAFGHTICLCRSCQRCHSIQCVLVQSVADSCLFQTFRNIRKALYVAECKWKFSISIGYIYAYE